MPTTVNYLESLVYSKDQGSFTLAAKHADERGNMVNDLKAAISENEDGRGSPNHVRRLLEDAAALGATPKTFYCLRDGDSFSSFSLELQGETKSRGLQKYVFGSSAGSTSPNLLDITTLSHQDGNLGGSVWPASIATGIWCAANPALLSGQRVLEFGSGVGIGGLAALAFTAAESVTLSDWDKAAPALVANLKANADANPRGADGARCGVELLDWEDALDPGFVPRARFGVAIGADCVYTEEGGLSLAAATWKHLESAQEGSPAAGYFWTIDRKSTKIQTGVAGCIRELEKHGTCDVKEFTLTDFDVATWSGDTKPLSLMTFVPF